MNEVNLIFPHQLFEHSPLLDNELPIYLIEEMLFFKQYSFHKQKITFHRATMKSYEAFLGEKNKEIYYIDAQQEQHDVRQLISHLSDHKIKKIHYLDPTDYWLEKRIDKACQKHKIKKQVYENQLFLNSKQDLKSFFKPSKKKFHQTSFYKQERKRLNILITEQNKPKGGAWTYDKANREKYPKDKPIPIVRYISETRYHAEAVNYTKKFFDQNLGILNESICYPIDHKQALDWLDHFLDERFAEFGTYEDAIVSDELVLHHSLLSPLLNVGLLLPMQVVDIILQYADKNKIPINSTEGIIRQIIGWREFIRGIYEVKGVEERTCNFWKFSRKIPDSFYKGKTGIEPVDTTIHKVLETGYCHHIERLMILGNFMLLCEFDPDEVYRWFMEFFIDAYDWVMVPNIYGMSQFADAGLLATKPYISSSNYVKKMSNYPKGDWQDTWDGLFWRFMDKHRLFFSANPRLSLLVKTLDKMDVKKKETHLKNADQFLNQL